MTRIALVVPGGVDRSGEVRVIPALLSLIRRLALRNDVEVFALAQEPEPACWHLEGARIHNIGTTRTRQRALLWIRAQHRRRPFDLVHSLWSGTPGLIAVTAAKLLRVPSLVHLAGGELVALPDIGYGGRLTWRGRLRERLVLRGASAISAASLPMIDAIAALGFDAERIPLGVDLQRWPPRAPERRPAGEPLRLIHVASLNRVKDPHLLIECMAVLIRRRLAVMLDVVGEDTLDGEIQRLAEQRGIAPYVRFHGFQPHGPLRRLVETAHVMVLTSRHEAGPLAVLEAAVAGVPTVGTRVGHLIEWAPQAAVAVPVGNALALADAIGALAAHEDRRLAIAQEAMHRAVIENAALTATRFQEIYDRLLRSAASR